MSIGSDQPFKAAGTVSLTAGTTFASVRLAGAGETVLVTNATASVAFVAFGSSSQVVATGASVPVLPNSRVLLAANAYLAYAAASLASGSGTIYFTVGDGSVI